MSTGWTSPSRTARTQRLLLEWWDQHGTPFPWRTARNPYWALVAGVCSQQTQMARALPLWERWTAAFPTIAALAAADRAAVLRVWAGAGYPRRALALRAAAQTCMTQHDGMIPREIDALLALPGVGPFTAAVVSCFGWNDNAPAIDTNVVRILGRLVYGHIQPALETSGADIATSAARLLPRGDAARWNAALMEYGARVCTPRPHCDECVIRRLCAARLQFEAGAVAPPVRSQGRFDGSDRQWRGRILRALRETEGPLRTTTLVRTLAANEGEATTVRRLLSALCADGMAWERGTRCGLGDAGVR